MLNKLKKEPALIGSLLSVAGSILGIFIHNPELVAALLGVAAVFLGVRQVVTPVTTMVEKVTTAATDAATEVVKTLDSTTVGVTGNITKAGESVINNTVDKVVGGLLG